MPVFDSENETSVGLESGASAVAEDAPFYVLLTGDWSGRNSRLSATAKDAAAQKPLEIDRDNFAEVMREMRVGIEFDLYGDGTETLALQFAEIDDFHPDSIFQRVSFFSNLRETRRRLLNPGSFNQTAKQVREWLGEPEKAVSTSSNQPPATSETPEIATENLLDQILSESDAPQVSKTPQPTAMGDLNTFIARLVRPHLVQTDENEQAKLVAAIDAATSELMRMILHNPAFQTLEAAWSGAFLVVSSVDTDSQLKIYLSDTTKDELAADLKTHSNLNESAFYKLLENEAANERSFAVIAGNYDFQPNVDDTATLMRVAKIAQKFQTPFIAAGSPAIFGIRSLAQTPDSDDWRISADSPEAKLWAMLRALHEAAYIGLAIPRFLARMPYGAKSEQTENFAFEELTAPPLHENYLWANPSFVCALLLAQSFSARGWEMKNGLMQDIENLPLHVYQEDGATSIKPCAEIFMTQKAADKIMNEGLMLLISFRDTDRIRLARFQSIAAPEKALQGKWTA